MPQDDFIPDFHEDDSPYRAERPAEEDPQAAQVSRSPLKGGGANFRTHKLKEVSPQRLEFRPSAKGLFFGSAFALPGFAMLVFGMKGLFVGGEPYDGRVALSIFGTLFGGAGAWLLYSMNRRVVFDKEKGYFWKGKLPEDPAHAEPGDWVRLDDIQGLQLLSEHVSGDDSSYHSYELNLVLHDYRRINVVDHGSGDTLTDEAQRIAYFLDVPVWDHR